MCHQLKARPHAIYVHGVHRLYLLVCTAVYTRGLQTSAPLTCAQLVHGGIANETDATAASCCAVALNLVLKFFRAQRSNITRADILDYM
jgi:hypothetical protein